MNIKLDKDVRVRLDQKDLINWKSKKHLEQKYKLGLQNFTLEMKWDSMASQSHLLNEKEGSVVVLSDEDALKLCNKSFPKSGIIIGDINIQVDQWSAETRIKHEHSLKGR